MIGASERSLDRPSLFARTLRGEKDDEEEEGRGRLRILTKSRYTPVLDAEGKMRTVMVIAIAMLAAYQGSTASRPAAGQDQAAIRGIVVEYLHARERRDADAVRALFTEDADQLTSSGDWRKGRDEIVRGTLASSQQTGGQRTITIETVRFPQPDMAIADGRYELAGVDEGTRKMWTSFVFVRSAGQWRIAAIRNMLPAPPAAAR
ncbi:MAG: hypothetical protein DMF84_00875 [Acidobacteria bacterium]|nr:MAG: hypothetical protein DMF84_00875 [Acidobacteriota bacterium]